MARVSRIASGTADLAVYRERAAHLPADSVTGWLSLARWAEAHDLLTQARESYSYVLSLEPENAVAHRGLGHVWIGDRWATLDESYRARGFVSFEGSWVSPDERRSILEERAASAAADRDRIEAEARTREAEARARVAEAEARRAERDAQYGGIPADMGYYGGAYPGVYGGGYGGAYGGGVYDPYGGGGYDPGLIGAQPPGVVVVPVPPPPRPQRPPTAPAVHAGSARAASGTAGKRQP